MKPIVVEKESSRAARPAPEAGPVKHRPLDTRGRRYEAIAFCRSSRSTILLMSKSS